MAKKPSAARGKATTKGKLKKAIKTFKERRELIGSRPKKSPGALGGRIKSGSKAPTGGLARKPKGIKGMIPMVGKAGAKGMSAFMLAKKLKPSGRLNVDDMKRAKALQRKKGK